MYIFLHSLGLTFRLKLFFFLEFLQLDYYLSVERVEKCVGLLLYPFEENQVVLLLNNICHDLG